MSDLPNCHGFWAKCAGRIDWTTYVDFTNLAAAGEDLGWRTLFYGPQSLLEQGSRLNMTVDGKLYSVPGYSVHTGGWFSRHVPGWYGREIPPSEMEAEGGGWPQRWTSFKALLLEKPTAKLPPKPIIFPSWHLDWETIDRCWLFDPSTVPLTDWVRRQSTSNVRDAFQFLTQELNEKLGRDYALAYEEAQLAVRIVDWLVANAGCEYLRLHSHHLVSRHSPWKHWLKRLQHMWGDMWGGETVTRVTQLVLQRISG